MEPAHAEHDGERVIMRPKPASAGAASTAFRGVRQRSWGKWVSEIREPKKKTRIWLGSFSTAEMAARAYDVASFCLKGHSALLNFTDSPFRFPPPSDLSPKNIQAAAAAAAAEFNTSSSGSTVKNTEMHFPMQQHQADRECKQSADSTTVSSTDDRVNDMKRKRNIAYANPVSCATSYHKRRSSHLCDSIPPLNSTITETVNVVPCEHDALDLQVVPAIGYSTTELLSDISNMGYGNDLHELEDLAMICMVSPSAGFSMTRVAHRIDCGIEEEEQVLQHNVIAGPPGTSCSSPCDVNIEPLWDFG